MIIEVYRDDGSREGSPIVEPLLSDEDLIHRGIAEMDANARACNQIEPVKKLVESYDILDLTLSIAKEFPVVITKLPECDIGALLHLRHLTFELGVYWHPYLPRPEFPKYSDKIKKLMVVYQVPRQK